MLIKTLAASPAAEHFDCSSCSRTPQAVPCPTSMATAAPNHACILHMLCNVIFTTCPASTHFHSPSLSAARLPLRLPWPGQVNNQLIQVHASPCLRLLGCRTKT